MGARKIALDALHDVVVGGAYAGQAISRCLRASRVSPEDSRLATSLFYTALENQIKLDCALGQFVKDMPESPIREVLHLAAAQILFMDKIPDHAAVDEAVKQVRSLRREQYAALVNGALRGLIRARDAGELKYPARAGNPIRALSVEYSAVEPLVKRLADAFGMDEAEKILAYRPGERWESIRPNLGRMRGEEFERYLAGRGWQFRRGDVPENYLVRRAGDLTRDSDFRDGLFTVQGAGSMLAAYAVEAKPGMTILDACAAPGGKSALMCELMQGTGRVYAYDVHEHRVELIRATGQRLKLYNLRPAVVDSTVFRPDRERVMDAVLIDAPCTGLGVLANKADVKLRFRDDEVEELARIQAKLLDTCARYVKLGGLLVYATCTLLPEENERQVRAFLERNAEYAPDPGDQWLPKTLRGRLNDGMIQLASHRDGGIDGFFIARLRRSGGR